jgi:type II secretory pathway pseudopilin PulG
MLVHLLEIKKLEKFMKIKKRFMTLLEIMIVILLIGVITSVVGYNMKGSLEKGKIFKTRQAKNQIKDLLLLEVAKGENIDEVVSDPEKFLQKSNLAKNPKNLLKDGWNDPFIITKKDDSDINVKSKKLEALDKKNNKKEDDQYNF